MKQYATFPTPRAKCVFVEGHAHAGNHSVCVPDDSPDGSSQQGQQPKNEQEGEGDEEPHRSERGRDNYTQHLGHDSASPCVSDCEICYQYLLAT